jgi:hypothetical protein
VIGETKRLLQHYPLESGHCAIRLVAQADISFAIGSADRYPRGSSAAKAEQGCLAPREPLVSAVQVEAAVANVVLTGQSYSKSEAVVEAEKAIDRALAPKKVRLVPLPRRWD